MQKKTIVTSAITTAVVLAALIATPTLAAVARSSDAPEAGQSMHTSQPYEQGEGKQGKQSKQGKQGGRSSHGSMGQGSKGQGGQGGQGQKMGGGTGGGSDLTDVASGTLTDEQWEQLHAEFWAEAGNEEAGA